MATFTTANNQFESNLTLSKQTGTTINIYTENQYVDKNIKLTIGARSADNLSFNVTNISGTNDVSIGTLASGKYPIIANNISVTGTLTAGTPGWFSTTTKTDSDTDNVTIGKIAAAVLNSEGAVTVAPKVTISGTTNMSTASSGTYYFTRTGTVSNGTVQTKYKATTAGYTPIVNATNGGTVTVTPTKTADATIYIPTATGTVTMTKGNGACSYTAGSSANITVSDTDTSGIKIAFSGSGSVSAVAKTTAGYTPANNSFATGASTSSNSATATKYITGVKLTGADHYFDITVPNGSDGSFITFRFTVGKNGYDVTVTEP